MRRSLALGLVLLGVSGLSAALARPQAGNPPKLDPDAVAVRLLLGIGDEEPRPWNGRVTLSEGEILRVEGYRFREGDAITGPDAWKAQSHLIRNLPNNRALTRRSPQQIAKGPSTYGNYVTANGVVVTLKAPDSAVLNVETENGNFKVPLASLANGSIERYLKGQAEAQRVPPYIPLVEGPNQDDFPSAAADAQGNAWVAYVVHEPRGGEVSEAFTKRPKDFRAFVPEGGGDQVRLLRFAEGQAGEPLDVTGAGLDVWRPAVAVDGKGGIVVVWSENRDENWDLYRRRYDPMNGSWDPPERLTTNPGTDADVVLATAPDGQVWMAWQSWIEGQAEILLAPADRADEAQNISRDPANDWSPALAIDRDGNRHVAFDTYRNGNYDVLLFSSVHKNNLLLPVADTPRFEVRPTLAVDARGRVWIAYEERDANWGKDAENLVEGEGSSLYRSGAVRVRVAEGMRVQGAPDPVAGASESLQTMNSYPRLAADPSGRIWLLFRHQKEAVWGNNAVMVIGGVWVEYATSLAGKDWSKPEPLSRSDGLLDNRPALVTRPEGSLLAFYNTDGRLHNEIEFTADLRRRFYTHSGTPAGVVNNELMVASLSPWGTGQGEANPSLNELRENGAVAPVHPDESADIARMRDHRIQTGGKTYRLLRGDFHRHSEISQDGGRDGALEDLWRYEIDAAGFEYGSDGDHDNGGGKEYTWWLVQKTTDLYTNPPGLVGMFTYERSVSYPHGHRNIMFARRGVRTLPRLVDDRGVIDADTLMLYDYLKQLGGICASHTSGTGMGTDWRDMNPQFEPFVEIFQGHRNSYEHLGAPAWRGGRRRRSAVGSPWA